MVLPVGAGRDENMAGKDTATGKDSGKRYGKIWWGENYGGKRYPATYACVAAENAMNMKDKGS
jgi:hypothetical protein